MAAFLNSPLVITLGSFAASPLETQPLLPGVLGSGTPTISNEIPADGSTVPPPLVLIQVLVN